LEFTSKQAADLAELHQQTVVRWSKEGLIKPSKKRRKFEPRRYTPQDIVALMIAKNALGRGFNREVVAEMTKMAQNADEEQQKNAALISLEGRFLHAGFVFQYFYPNVHDPEQAENIKQADQAGVIVTQVRFYDVVQEMLACINDNYIDEKLVDAQVEAE